MGYELYRQLANRRHRRKRPKGPEFDMEEDNQSKNILEGRLHFMLGVAKSVIFYNVRPTYVLKFSLICTSHLFQT